LRKLLIDEAFSNTLHLSVITSITTVQNPQIARWFYWILFQKTD